MSEVAVGTDYKSLTLVRAPTIGGGQPCDC